MTHPADSLQEQYAPNSTCFGCGPANPDGLRIRSFYREGEAVATWQGQRHHEAFTGFLNGGIISTLLDCHCNWAAIGRAMQELGYSELPCTVTAKLDLQFLAPTPSREPITMRARVNEVDGRRFEVTGEIVANDRVTAKCRAHFIAVQPGHPAYHRWS